jgi:hypothetical protein
MSTCTICGGLIAEPNKAYGFAGKFCHCGWAAKPEPYKDIESTPEETRRQWEEFNKRTLSKGDVKKPSLSHILNLCEQLSSREISALIVFLGEIHDEKKDGA